MRTEDGVRDGAPADATGSLRSAVRGFLVARASHSAVRHAIESPEGFDTQTWLDMCSELALPSLLVPKLDGGAGAGMLAAAVVFEELGRSLCPSPLMSSMIATWAIAHVSDAIDSDELLPALSSGTTRATIALGSFGHGQTSSAGLRSVGGRIRGKARDVLDARTADWLVVEAYTCSGAALYVVGATDPRVTLIRREQVDRTRRLDDLGFDAAPARWFAGAKTAARVRAVASTALACSELGGAQAALDDAVHHSRLRKQFGRPIPSLQSMRQLSAELDLAIDSARIAATRAVVAIDRDEPDLPELASVAKSLCSDTYMRAAEVNMAIHGAIGATRHHAAQLHLERATSDAVLFSSPEGRADTANSVRLTF